MKHNGRKGGRKSYIRNKGLASRTYQYPSLLVMAKEDNSWDYVSSDKLVWVFIDGMRIPVSSIHPFV
jgi:hypothetical protein